MRMLLFSSKSQNTANSITYACCSCYKGSSQGAAIFLSLWRFCVISLYYSDVKSLVMLHEVTTLPLCITHMLNFEGLRMGSGILAFSDCAFHSISVFCSCDNFIQYKGSACAPAFAGAHASGRAGQHFDNLRCSCPIWHALNFKVMPRV